MPLQITGRHMAISTEQRDYINKKVERIRRLCPKIDEMSFTLTKEKMHYECEANLRAGRIAAQAVTTAPQPLEAIDDLIDKLEAQVSKTKERRADKKAAGREKANSREQAAAEEEEDLAGAEEEEEERMQA